MKKYAIVYSKGFRQDVKKMVRSGYDRNKLESVIGILAEGKDIPESLRNHRLKGDWSGVEECHIEPDWLLIYERHESSLVLIMLRTGTHSEIFKK